MTSLLELILTVTFIVVCDGFQVTLYSSTHHSGNWANIDVNDCVNLDDHNLCQTGFIDPISAIACEIGCCSQMEAADNVESINTHDNCVRVYRNRNCNQRVGPRIEPGSDCHSDWGDIGCGFKNDIRSISPCDSECINPANHLVRRSGDTTETHRLRDETEIRVTFLTVGGVKVPHFLEAFLWNTFEGRTDFKGVYWAARFWAMLGRQGIDARGHLLASSLGGKAEDWNFAPQRKEINNGDGTGQGWKSLELKIRNHLNAEHCNYVYWQQVIAYENTPRPQTFCITAHFFETWHHRLADVEHVTLQCYNTIDNPINGFCETTSQPCPDGRP